VTVALLGWIKPDDGVRFGAEVAEYECYGLDGWLRARGVTGVRVAVERSVADNGHGVDQLHRTGEAARLLAPARRLVEAGAGALCWACTSGSFVGGPEWSQAQLAALAAGTGRPVTSASVALAEAVRSLGATEVDLLSPYPGPLTQVLTAFLGAFGVGIRGLAALDCQTGGDSHRLDLRIAVAGFAPHLSRSPVPLLIPDSAVNTLELVGELERDLGRPVVTANQATLWKGLGLLGLPARVPGVGALLAGRTAMPPPGASLPGPGFIPPPGPARARRHDPGHDPTKEDT
jgi:maleate cis-trans isomerase